LYFKKRAITPRVLPQWDPNTSYQLVPPEEHGEATAGELPLSTISKDNGNSGKWQITNNHSPSPMDPQIQFPTPQVFQDTPLFHPIIPRF